MGLGSAIFSEFSTAVPDSTAYSRLVGTIARHSDRMMLIRNFSDISLAKEKKKYKLTGQAGKDKSDLKW